MTPAILYAITGIGLFVLGVHALARRAHLLNKIIALNIMGSGIFLVFGALAYRTPNGVSDPVPHAMVITGIVVAISATAVALTLMLRLQSKTGAAELPEQSPE